MVDHRAHQKEGHIRAEVKVNKEVAHRGQSPAVVLNAERVREKVAVLDQRLLALVVQLADQLQVGVSTTSSSSYLPGALLEDDAVALLRHQYAQRHRQSVLQQGVLQSDRRLLDVAHLIEGAALRLEQLAAAQRLQLLVGHLLGGVDAGHLLHNLLENQQVEALVHLQLVGDELQQAGQLHRVLLHDGAAEVRQADQPGGDAGALVLRSLLRRVGEHLDDAEEEDIVGDGGEVLERVDHRADQVVVRLNLPENLKRWKRGKGFG